jgi:hypothetical protein
VRYDSPKLAAFNFVLDDEGGVNASLGLDGHGKALSFLLLPRCASMRRSSRTLSIPHLLDPQPNNRYERQEP